MSNVIRSLIVKVGADTTDFTNKMNYVSKDLKGIGKSMNNTGRDLSRAGTTLTKGITLPIVGIGTASVNTAMNFEAQMSRVQAISGATGDELKLLNDQALDLGAKTKFGATEAAEGMENLASAGFTTSEIMAAMPGLLDLAASSGEDLARSSDIAASTLRGFGIDAEKTGHVADVLAKLAADTNAAVADTGEAMKYIAPVASAMGISLEETAAAIGIMSDAGIKGSQAGTTMRGALTRLVKPTKQMSDVMEDLGLSFFDANGNMLSMEGIIKELEEGTVGLTQEQENNVIATLFGQDAMSGMLALIEAGPDKLSELTKGLENSDGAAEAMAKTMMDNGKGSIEEMMGSVETAGIKIGNALTPHVTNLAEHIGKLADKFSKLSPEQQDMIINMGLAAAAIGPVIGFAGDLTKGLGGVFDIASDVTKGFGNFSKAVEGGSSILGALGTALGPGGAILIGLGATAGAAVLIYQNWDLISESVKKAIDWVKKFIGIDEESKMSKEGFDYYEYGQGNIRKIPGQSKVRDSSISADTKWNADGAIFTRPTVLPTIAGWQGFGEAGPEAVLPLSKLDGMLSEKSQTVNHTGTITVRGVNNRNELMDIVDIVVDQLRREVRA